MFMGENMICFGYFSEKESSFPTYISVISQILSDWGFYNRILIQLFSSFSARVLVGRTTTGNGSTRVCPPGFDTTGGKDVFVTYHDAQAYGQYLITYR
jgi:hypothetical protein